MFLNRIVAYPESRRILRLHVCAQVFMAVDPGVFAMVPVLLRGRFAATEWQTMLATASQAFMSLLAIFWNEQYRRLRPASYLLLLWCLSTVPLAGAAACSTAGPVLVFVLIAAMGAGGVHSVNGDLLRSCYAPGTRSKVWSLLKITEQITIMSTAFCIGRWLDYDRNAYRLFLPLTVCLIGLGMILLTRITRHRLFRERLDFRPPAPLSTGSPIVAYRNMAHVLAEDVDFRRYETAFCVYGLGWMICYAMMPFVVVDVLHLTFAQAAVGTQVAYQLTMLAMLLPVGYLMDRLGAIRMSVWSFTFLLVYPVMLMTAGSVHALVFASIFYGIGMAGVNLAWTLGPVSLARDASQASQYLAIHATLVSLRALLGQVPAVAIYWYTKDRLGPAHAILIPLTLAAIMFAVGATLMRRLERDRRAPVVPAHPLEPIVPAEITAGAET